MAAHTIEIKKMREVAMDDGQKRDGENRRAEEPGGEAAICIRDKRAPMRNWLAVRTSGPTIALRNSCLVMMVAATLHTYLTLRATGLLGGYVLKEFEKMRNESKTKSKGITHHTQTCATRRITLI